MVKMYYKVNKLKSWNYPRVRTDHLDGTDSFLRSKAHRNSSILRDPRVHNLVQNSLPLIHTLSQFNPFHNPIPSSLIIIIVLMNFLHSRLGLVPSGFLTEILHTLRHLRVTCPSLIFNYLIAKTTLEKYTVADVIFTQHLLKYHPFVHLSV